MNNNDSRIIELKNKIEEEREKLKDYPVKKFVPITNCLLTLDGITYNLHIDSSLMVLIKLNSIRMSAIDLNKNFGIEIDADNIKISGYCLKDWITDVKNNIMVSRYKCKQTKLSYLEDKLNNLLSEDKKTELELDKINEDIFNLGV